MTPRAVCQEYKVVAPLTKTKAARHGPRIGDARRGTEARSPTSSATSIVYAFGNTEERYRIKILGCKGKGTLGVDRPFNPHYQSWSRDGRATTTTLFASRFGPDREWL
jgi:hypothetical protein